jgi:hypothetical protein
MAANPLQDPLRFERQVPCIIVILGANRSNVFRVKSP